MGTRPWRHQAVRLGVAMLLTAAPVVASRQTVPASATGDGKPRALVAEYDGIIHPIAAEFFDEVITRADASQATVAVLMLRTPGGLLESTRTIVSRMIAAQTPVVVFVGPSGARAASAGFIIALAADVAVMAPGTHIGAAHPVSAEGRQAGDETMAKKAASDAAAYARTLAETRGRNAVLAAEAVTESRAFTDREARAASPPLIDFVAADIEDLLRQLDGRRITRFDGRILTLETRDAAVEHVQMTRRQQFLSAIAHPQIAYLMLTLGMLGLVVELWNPGAILPGVVGGLCLLLAFFAFQVLPVNASGLLLIAFGVALLAFELKVPSYGVLGVGGTLALLVGSLMITREVPGVHVGYGVIVPAVVAVAGIFLFLGRLALKAHQMSAVTGAEGLVGEHGQTLTPLEPSRMGQVSVHGEIWRGTSATPIPAGCHVRVTAISGLTVHVERSDVDEPQGVTS